MCVTLLLKSNVTHEKKARKVFMQKQPAEAFFKKGAMTNFAKFTRKRLCQNLFFDKVKLCRSATSLKSRLFSAGVSCEFCEICKNIFFAEHNRTNASVSNNISSSEGRIGKWNCKL